MKKILLLSLMILFGASFFMGNGSVYAISNLSPVAYWDFDSGSEVNAGLVSDISGNYDSENNAGTWVSSGFSGGALKLDCYGDSNTCGIKTPVIPTNTEYTLSFRLKIEGLSSSNIARQIFTAYEANAYLYGALASDSTEINKVTTAQMGKLDAVQDSSWHHYAFTWDNSGEHKFYLDGLLAGFANGPSIRTVSSEFVFGFAGGLATDTAPVLYFDELKLFNYVFSELDLAQEFSGIYCDEDTWQCSDWDQCSVSGSQSRTCSVTDECPHVVTPSPSITQSCTLECSSWTYSDWGECSSSGQQTRTIISSLPQGCTGGSPVLAQPCTYVPPCSEDTWQCSDWNQCSSSGTQSRTCNKTFDCPSVATPSPSISQSCTAPAPTCTADIWECDSWNACSATGLQSRSCRKTFDCPTVQTASPSTDQFCRAPSNPNQQQPSTDEVTNQDTIIKSTVKLFCPVDETSASQGSGTVIDSSGTILTNKHVIAGTLGCLVGFVDDYNDEPYFGDRQIADIVRQSPSEDIALLKLRNPSNRRLTHVSVAGTSSNVRLGKKIYTYGYPADFGTRLTFTSGDFSGSEGVYIKTTAILEHGNSGGGAYLQDGTFIGIPTAARGGSLNTIGLILSIDTVNAWMSNRSIASNGSSSNQYSRVSALESIDVNNLDSFDLFIAKTDDAGNLVGRGQYKGLFPDVSSSHPNAIAIEDLKERGIISGYPDGKFKPDDTVNRAELMKILVNGKVGAPDANVYKNCFPDVTTEWFAQYVCYAQSMEWVQGYPDGTFKPTQAVNKVEALKMLLNSQGVSVSSTVNSSPFDDVGTNAWFAKYVAKAKEFGLLEETGSLFSPTGAMRRGGISENLYRLLVR